MEQSKIRVTVKDEFCIEEKPPPSGVIIFGASGDLTSRKLIPALYNLSKRNLLPKEFYVMGCARSSMTDEEFRKKACLSISDHCDGTTDAEAERFAQIFHYVHGDYGSTDFYAQLKSRLEVLDGEYQTGGNHIFYMATPPAVYENIIAMLGACNLVEECEGGPCARVVVEKPFGRDLESAHALDRKLHEVLHERQIYRIDHYLGKETVQNILLFRFANSIFEPVWNRRYVDHVQITVAESIGVEHRAGYYDKAGALRDMFQNHMFQMLSLVAMEPPSSFAADRVRDEKVKLMRAVRQFPLDSLNDWMVRGQYDEYRHEEGIDPESRTETFVAAKFMIDNWRWRDVPFYMRAGKHMNRRISEIAVVFKKLPHSMFAPIKSEELTPNVLVMNVQPDEGMALTIEAKHPGAKLCMSALTMDFKYRELFVEDLPDAYERLLMDCMLGDQTLFNRRDGMELSWSLFTPVLKRWDEDRAPESLPIYKSGTWGPPESDALLARDGRSWRLNE
jgi:glucose-6-phosphate 1-dehydrogenase